MVSWLGGKSVITSYVLPGSIPIKNELFGDFNQKMGKLPIFRRIELARNLIFDEMTS